MTPEQERHMEMWLAALRSGEFPQGDGSLCCNGRYCCLGVAAELACGPDGSAELAALRCEPPHQKVSVWYDDNFEVLSERFMEWLGLQTSYGGFRLTPEVREILGDALDTTVGEDESTSLAELNDYGLPFPVIADVIAARPPELFVDNLEGLL